MRHLAPLCLAVVAVASGCTGRTSPLLIRDQIEAEPDAGDLDSGIVDSSFLPADAGFADAGIIDSGLDDACRFYGDYTQRLSISTDRDFYEGTAFVLNSDPFDVQLANGEVIRISVGQANLPSDFSAGRALWLQFGQDTPQWQNLAVALSEVAPNDGPGRLRFAAWAFGEVDDFELDFDSVTATYGRDDCTPEDFVACGPAAGMVLTVDGPAVAGAQIRPGEVQFFRTMEIGNGRSHQYVRFPECTDTPSSWFEGYVSIFN